MKKVKSNVAGAAKAPGVIEEAKPRRPWLDALLLVIRLVFAYFILKTAGEFMGIGRQRYHYYYFDGPSWLQEALLPGLLLTGLLFLTGIGVRVLACVILFLAIASFFGMRELRGSIYPDGFGILCYLATILLAWFGPGNWVIWNLKTFERPKSPPADPA